MVNPLSMMAQIFYRHHDLVEKFQGLNRGSFRP